MSEYFGVGVDSGCPFPRTRSCRGFDAPPIAATLSLPSSYRSQPCNRFDSIKPYHGLVTLTVELPLQCDDRHCAAAIGGNCAVITARHEASASGKMSLNVDLLKVPVLSFSTPPSKPDWVLFGCFSIES